MSYLDDYKKRLQGSGSSNADAFKKSTIDIINKTFSESPFYRLAKINGLDVGVRVIEGRDSKEKTFLFLPGSKIDIGSLVEIDGVRWLIMDFQDNEVFPKATAKRCNEKIKWMDKVGNLKEYNCVATASRYIKYDIGYNRYDVDLLQGGMFIYAQQGADIKQIVPAQRFIFGQYVYEISGVDDLTFTELGVGVVQFTTRLTTIVPNDNFTTHVADNAALYQHIDPPSGGGGGLW